VRRLLLPLFATAALVAGMLATAGGAAQQGHIEAAGFLTESAGGAHYFRVQDRQGHPIGSLVLGCAELPRHEVMQCTATLQMPLGRVQLSGTARRLSLFQFAVTGTTGGYRQFSAGNLVATRDPGHGWALDITLR